MTMTPNNRNHQLGSSSGHGRSPFKRHADSMRMFRGTQRSVSFEEHTSLMRSFRRSHPSILVAGSPQDEQLALLKSVQFLPITSAIAGAGGTRRFIVSGEKTAIIPLLRVTLHSLSLN